MSTSRPLHIRTPLLESFPLSRGWGRQVYLKMENLQPTGSFKIRGIGLLCQMGRDDGVRHFVASSGGNAGYAAAYAGRQLDIPTTVFVPIATSPDLRRQIELQGAEIRAVGDVWDETHEAALRFSRDVNAFYISPFDHPLIWQGHSTIVDEILDDVGKPDAIVLSVGGGGLLCGVLEGLQRHGLTDVSVVAVETEGTASLAASLKAGKLVTLDRITGVATSLGARTVAQKALDWSIAQRVQSVVLSDAQAIDASIQFADDHRCLVEPACGAALSVAYQQHAILDQARLIVMIVCGGIGVNLPLLQRWRSSRETKGL
jgi:L-serine/L-threonine ammonia-lyase